MVQVGSSFIDLSSSGRVELEGPEEVGGGLEVGAAGLDFIDEVLDADDVLLSESLLDGEVGAEGDALSVDLAEASFIYQLSDGLSVGIPG